MLAGKPNALTFPITSLTFEARSPWDPAQQTTMTVKPDALADGLQYGPTAGPPDLVNWFEGMQERSHGRYSGEGWRITLATGSQDLIFKVMAFSRSAHKFYTDLLYIKASMCMVSLL